MNVVARRMFVPVVVAIVFAVALAVPSARTLFAQESNRAVVINGRTCFLADGNGNFFSTNESHNVITSSGNGIFTCSLQGVSNSTGRAVHYDFSSTGGQMSHSWHWVNRKVA